MENARMTHEEFIRRAIETLRSQNYRGIHSVYSGFNEAFKQYFPGEDPVQATTALAAIGKIQLMPVKGGVMIYLPGDAPAKLNRGEEALRKMGINNG
jgi:hypothetical protein